MARQTNWLDSWDPYDSKRFRNSGLTRTAIKQFVKTQLVASDNTNGEQHSMTLKWKKLSTSPVSFRLVANLTPAEKRRGNGSGDSVISPKVTPQP
jgi:hypothetical protein